MSYLIIALVVAVVIGPVLWLKPSPREKQLQRLRRCAHSEGLRVHLRAVPPNHGDGPRVVEPAIMAYIRPWSEQERKSSLPATFTLPCLQGDWQSYRSKGIVGDELLRALPDSCRLLEVSEEGLLIYWRERGDESRVKQLRTTMEDICQALLRGAGNKYASKT
ncbi:MAG: hypothetical protein RL336_428 [Pseudomonadota bacterium]|jgi:hypothetical protein